MNTFSRGFTLVEVMIVVAIIAILATIAMPSYRQHVEKGRVTTAKALLNQARQHAHAEFLKTGKYPNTTADYKNVGGDLAKYHNLSAGIVKNSKGKDEVVLTAQSKESNNFGGEVTLNINTGEFKYDNCVYKSVCTAMARTK